MMKDNYTKNALAALRAAKSASKKAKQNYIGTEHVILGLAQEPEGVASRILAENGVTGNRLQEMIAQLNIHPGSLALLDQEGYSPRCQKVLHMAAAQARKYRSDQTGTEHILLAIILERENVAAKACYSIRKRNQSKVCTALKSAADNSCYSIRKRSQSKVCTVLKSVQAKACYSVRQNS